MGDNELPTFIAVIASAIVVVGVMVAMAAVTWLFLLTSP